MQSAADAEEMARKQLTSTKAMNMANLATRKPRKEAPKEQRGVSEQFVDELPREAKRKGKGKGKGKGEDKGGGGKDEKEETAAMAHGNQLGALFEEEDEAEWTAVRSSSADIVAVNQSSFERIVLDEKRDVVVMFHSQGCEGCGHMAVYYKRVGLRFRELGIKSLVVARMDVTDESPPPFLKLQLPSLPSLVMFPAKDKGPPFRFFSGIAKVLEMMKWAHSEASVIFELPDHAHLNPADVVEFKIQVAEREQQLAEMAMQEAEAIQAEEERKAAAKAKRRQREDAAKQAGGGEL